MTTVVIASDIIVGLGDDLPHIEAGSLDRPHPLWVGLGAR